MKYCGQRKQITCGDSFPFVMSSQAQAVKTKLIYFKTANLLVWETMWTVDIFDHPPLNLPLSWIGETLPLPFTFEFITYIEFRLLCIPELWIRILDQFTDFKYMHIWISQQNIKISILLSANFVVYVCLIVSSLKEIAYFP